MTPGKQLTLQVLRGQVLGAKVYRGYARLCDLARISKPDIYDQKDNPLGTQRDLSPKHAKQAYEYVKNRDLGYWPEIFLCVRDKSTITYRSSKPHLDFGRITINIEKAKDPNHIAISRVDGNHRLHFADGSKSGFPEITKTVSFCIAYDLNLEQEITLFRDINANQKAMNTSHLDNIETRLTEEDTIKSEQPALFIASKLGRDKKSPLFDLVWEGGKRSTGHIVPLKSLHRGINYMLSKPTKLTALRDPEAEYIVIRNYFSAVKRWQPQAWKRPKAYITLRGSGLWGICLIGAEVIDRVLAKGDYKDSDMLKILISGRAWNWANKGDFQGYGGSGGARKISDKVIHEFEDESGISVKSTYRKIIKGG